MATEKERPEQPATTAGPPDGFDREKYFILLYENPLEAQQYAAQFDGTPAEDLMVDILTRGVSGVLRDMRQDITMVNRRFKLKHPDYLRAATFEGSAAFALHRFLVKIHRESNCGRGELPHDDDCELAFLSLKELSPRLAAVTNNWLGDEDRQQFDVDPALRELMASLKAQVALGEVDMGDF